MLDQFRTQKLEWNRANNQIYDRVEANSGDSNGRTLFVQILNGGMVEDLTGAVLSLAWNKRTEQGLEAFEEVDAKKGQFRLFYPTGMLENHGVLQASLVLVDVTGRIESKSFDIIVHKGTVDDEAVESDDKFTALTTALVKVSQVQAEFDGLYADKSQMMDTLKVEKSNEMDQLYDDKNQALTGLESDFADKAENLETTYAPRLTSAEQDITTNHQEVTAQLAQAGEGIVDVERAVNYYWIPETQPPARTDEIGWFMDAFSKTSDEYIADIFEPLRAVDPDYITRELMGKDATGTLDYWRYIFTPKNYKKTILISTCLHGGEISPMVAMVRFLDALVHDWEKYPQLGEIRENVRIVYIPFANPWGVSAKPRTRQNGNGVDLNRNFGYGWANYTSTNNAPFGHDYKGTAAMSEVETQYFVKNVSDFPDAVACLDFHNTGQTTRSFYSVVPLGYPYKELEQLVDYFSAKWSLVNPISFFEQEGKPNACEYVWNTFGIPASHPEWCDITTTGGRQHDSEEVTHSLAWFANIIIEHCRSFQPKVDFVSTTVTNRVTNASLSLDKVGWVGNGIGYTAASNGVLSGTGTSGNQSPSFMGDLSKNDFSKGDLIYASAKAIAPANCQKIELVFRDMTAGITGVVASISSPEAGVEQTLSGQYVFETTSSAPKLQIRYYFAPDTSVVNQPFSISEPFVLALTTDLNVREIAPGDLNFVFDQIGEFFVGTKQVDFIRNISSLDKTTLASTMFLLNKIKALG